MSLRVNVSMPKIIHNPIKVGVVRSYATYVNCSTLTYIPTIAKMVRIVEVILMYHDSN